MLKRCKITAQAKPMWFRKAPDCLHRQILKKYFPMKRNPPTHPPPPSPLTRDSLSITARQLSASFSASWPEPKFRNWQLMAGDHSAEGTRCSPSPATRFPAVAGVLSCKARRASAGCRGFSWRGAWSCTGQELGAGSPPALPAPREAGLHLLPCDGEGAGAESPGQPSRPLSLPTALVAPGGASWAAPHLPCLRYAKAASGWKSSVSPELGRCLKVVLLLPEAPRMRHGDAVPVRNRVLVRNICLSRDEQFLVTWLSSLVCWW